LCRKGHGFSGSKRKGKGEIILKSISIGGRRELYGGKEKKGCDP